MKETNAAHSHSGWVTQGAYAAGRVLDVQKLNHKGRDGCGLIGTLDVKYIGIVREGSLWGEKEGLTWIIEKMSR